MAQSIEPRQVITLGPLTITVDGRAAPDAADAWNRNWLRTTVTCATPDKTLRASGSLLSAAHLHPWMSELEKLVHSSAPEAALIGNPPYLEIRILKANAAGQHEVIAQVVDPQRAQQERSVVGIDQLDPARRETYTAKFTVTRKEIGETWRGLRDAAPRYPAAVR